MDDADRQAVVGKIKEFVAEAGPEGVAKDLLFDRVEQELGITIEPKRRGPLVKAAGLQKVEQQGDVFYTLSAPDPESEELDIGTTLPPGDDEPTQTTQMWIEASGTLKFESDDGTLKIKARVTSFSFERKVGEGGE